MEGQWVFGCKIQELLGGQEGQRRRWLTGRYGEVLGPASQQEDGTVSSIDVVWRDGSVERNVDVGRVEKVSFEEYKDFLNRPYIRSLYEKILQHSWG